MESRTALSSLIFSLFLRTSRSAIIRADFLRPFSSLALLCHLMYSSRGFSAPKIREQKTKTPERLEMRTRHTDGQNESDADVGFEGERRKKKKY